MLDFSKQEEDYNQYALNSEALGYNKADAAGYFSKLDWDNYTSNYNLDCKPNKEVTICKASANPNFYLYDTRPALNYACLPVSPRVEAKATDLFGGF